MLIILYIADGEHALLLWLVTSGDDDDDDDAEHLYEQLHEHLYEHIYARAARRYRGGATGRRAPQGVREGCS